MEKHRAQRPGASGLKTPPEKAGAAAASGLCSPHSHACRAMHTRSPLSFSQPSCGVQPVFTLTLLTGKLRQGQVKVTFRRPPRAQEAVSAVNLGGLASQPCSWLSYLSPSLQLVSYVTLGRLLHLSGPQWELLPRACCEGQMNEPRKNPWHTASAQ